MAKIIKLILTYERRGLGSHDDPVRMCPQLYSLTGDLIADFDPMPKGDLDNPRQIFVPDALYRGESP